jgi:GTPase SAR1 family protein
MLLDKITSGKIIKAQKLVVYGPEGIGKSTFASKFPRPLFIDTEGSTTHMDVTRTPKLSSWTMLVEIIKEVKNHPQICETLVIDTADWAEILCANFICDRAKMDSIESFGYGKGYTYLEEEFGKMLNLLQDVIDVGINVVLTAHAQMRKFEQPDELGGYDRWELKLEKKTSALVKEWADIVLFANYKTYVVNVDNQGAQKGKNKAQGGTRMMYTTHHPCWDAKNRHDLPSELPFDFSSIASVLIKIEQPVLQAPIVQAPATTPAPAVQVSEPVNHQVQLPHIEPAPTKIKNSKIPKALLDLMEANNVTEENIQQVVAQRGYYPANTPIENYDIDFINGSLVGAWPAVYKMIQTNILPFEIK